MRDKPVRDSLIRLLGAAGMHVCDRTSRAELGALIESLRPLDSGIPLIRLGPAGDGGYLVPDDLTGIEHAFSPGVSTESGFESDLAARGMRVFLADGSVAAPPVSNPGFVFEKKYVGCVLDEQFTTLDDWKRRMIPDGDGDLLLQMDIEGAEFEALLNASDALLAQFRIMVIEFHYLQQLYNKSFYVIVSRLFAKLLKQHSVVHIHPNNCCGSVRGAGFEIPRIAEFTFLRNDRFRRREPRRDFPHRLDADNTRKRSLPLPECWYR
ncbi:MAG: FkbM family methyltransferase [Gammaproteobacteria bacterium]|nr:FkbM family methyltransferase [Gammaproteobacteria bacterium]